MISVVSRISEFSTWLDFKGKGNPTAIREIVFTCFCNSAQFLVKRHRSYKHAHFKVTLQENRPLKAISFVYLSNALSEMHVVIYINTSSLFSGKIKKVANGDIYGKLV